MAKGKQSAPAVSAKQNIAQPPRFTEIQRYFSKYTNPQNSSITFDSMNIAMKQLSKTEKTLWKGIKKGQIKVKQESDDLKQMLIKETINQQENKTQLLKKKREELVEALKRLDMRQNVQSSSPLNDRKYSNLESIKYVPGVLSKQQHENMIEKIKKAQEQINRRHQMNKRKLQQKIAEEEENIRRAQQEKFINDKQMRKMKSEHNMGIRRESFEKNKLEQARANQHIEMLKSSPPLYKLKEEEYYNEVIAPTLQEKKNKLKQIREFSRNFSVKDINNHQKKYIQDRNMSIKQSRARTKLNQEWAYKPPSKTSHLTHALEEELIEKKQKLLQKKKNIEEKILRQQNYVKILKEKHYPQNANNHLRMQLEERMRKLHTQRRMTPEKSTRQLGLQNLKLAKHKKQKSQLIEPSSIREVREIRESSVLERKKMFNQFNYLRTKQDPEYYNQVKQKQLDKILKSPNHSPQKQKQLEIESKKIEEALNMKKQLLKVSNNPTTRNQTAELMLTSIKTKMGLMKLYE